VPAVSFHILELLPGSVILTLVLAMTLAGCGQVRSLLQQSEKQGTDGPTFAEPTQIPHRAGQALQNSYAEFLNNRLRDECLNTTEFWSIGHESGS
jgi:hypothetical protein